MKYILDAASSQTKNRSLKPKIKTFNEKAGHGQRHLEPAGASFKRTGLEMSKDLVQGYLPLLSWDLRIRASRGEGFSMCYRGLNNF